MLKSRLQQLITCFLLIFTNASYSETAPADVFNKIQEAKRYDELKDYLTPHSRALYEKYPIEQREKLVSYNRYRSYKTKEFPISASRAILVVFDIVYNDPARQGNSTRPDPEARIAYDFIKTEGKWMVNEAVSANMVIPSLLKKKIDPSLFDTKNNFSYAGESVAMQSAFAYSSSNGNVTIEFYPFPLTIEDIEYYKFATGKIKNEKDKASTITSSLRYPSAKLILILENNKFTFWNIIYSKFAEIPFSETIGSNDISYIETVEYDGKAILVKSNSSYEGVDGKISSWNININLPVFPRGL